MQLLTHTLNTHLHAFIRPHFNIEFNFDVSVSTCMMWTVTLKLNSTLLVFFDDIFQLKNAWLCSCVQTKLNVN